ncbi:MAG TPA: nuclear transport factor 2 family protein [Candidatus Sulfotelmatobacter sp.]|nr:nuclear transport factor 2 family protein [Candidatus Sulfotelmatobacter sp.]
MAEERAAREVLELERRRFEALVRKDFGFLDAVLGEELIYTHSSGVRESKARLMASLRSGDLVYESAVPEKLQALCYGAAAVLTGEASMKVQSRGQDLGFRILYTNVYARRDGRWQMVAWQATRKPDA